MRNSSIRRYISGISALLMMSSVCSCSLTKGENSDSNSPQSVQTADEVVKNSYSAIDIEAEIPLDYVDQIFYVRDSANVIISGTKNEENVIYMSDIDFTDFREVAFNFERPKNSQYYTRLTVAPDGTIYALVTLIDYGDFVLPDYSDPNFDYENFDYDAMNESAQYTCTLYTLGTDGEIISENELTNLDKFGINTEEDAVHIRDITACPDGTLIVSFSGEEETYCTMNADGELLKKIDTGSIHWVNLLGNDSDGNAVCACYTESGPSIMNIDMEAGKFTESNIDVNESGDFSNITGINAGIEEYNLLLTTSNALYGTDKDGNVTEIINWLDSDIKGNSVRSVIASADGDYIIYYEDYETSKSGFARLTERDPEELANQTIITVGMLYSDSSVTSKITEFNKTNTDYRIKVADYSKYDKWDDEGNRTGSAEKELKMDIVSDKAPDMIITYDYSIISELAPKGAYANLYDYLKDDEDLSKDDILPNVLKASEINGKLYALSPTFSVQTMACKTKHCDKENWTLDDMIEIFDANPDMDFSQYNLARQYVFEDIVRSCDSFVDYKKKTCSFDSGEFKKILEFCNRFPDESKMINWETATQEEMDEYYSERDVALRNDKALLGSISLYDFREYMVQKKGMFGDDITFVGIPSDDGKGAYMVLNNAFAILDSSPSKDACWDFVKTFFTEEEYANQNRGGSVGLPTRVSAFEKSADESMEKPYFLNEDGTKEEYDMNYYMGGQEFTVDPLTQKERDYIVDYIKGTEKILSGYSDEIINIITEEVDKYFKGSCTSSQAVDMIQNRVSLFISEQG